MSPQQMPNAGSVPDDIESPAAKLVYLYLTMTGEATLSDLQNGLDLKRLTLYTILKTLRERGLVQEDGDAYAPA
jgi:predicted transcriptional regulator